MVTSETLREIAFALYGDVSNAEMVAGLAGDLEINVRNVERMLSGSKDIPAGLGMRLALLLDKRVNVLRVKLLK